MNDPLGDMINRLKTAGNARLKHASVPYSAFKWELAQKLKEGGFVKDVVQKGKDKPSIEFTLLYKEDGTPHIHDAVRVSKLSRRMYTGYKDIKPVKRGHGIVILTTPQGLLTGDEARKAKVGGEIICEIW